MAGDARTTADSLKLLEKIANDPRRFGFFEALRWLECAFAQGPRIGYASRPIEEKLRIGQTATLAFATSSIDSLEPSKLHDHWRLQVLCFGMFGSNGPLPTSLTEYVYERRHLVRDVTFSRFVDIFHHRLATLFYRAWADAQPTVQLDRPHQDRFSFYVGTFLGIGPKEFRYRDAMPDHAKLHQAGHFSCQTRHPDGLAAILSSFFGTPARVVEFVGRWMEIPAECRLSLGKSPSTGALGQNALVGARMWDRQQNIRVELGPMTWREYRRLLPDGRSLPRLAAVIHNYVGYEFRWDARLILRQAEVPRTQLGRQGQLGWTAWIGNRPHQRDADDLVLSRAIDRIESSHNETVNPKERERRG
ncbi:MAG: type VI secretion system baseplate subunit TssG [Pirellulales bacterium]